MSDIAKRYATEVAKPDSPLRKDVERAAVKGGVGLAAIYGVSALVPFLTFLPALIITLVALGYWKFVR